MLTEMPKIHYGVDTDQPKGVFYDRIVDSERYTSHASAEHGLIISGLSLSLLD